MNNKAQSQFSIFTVMIVAFLFLVFSAGLIYISGLLNDVFTQIGVDNEVNAGSPTYVNMSLYSEQIWGEHYESIQALRLVSFVYILVMFIAIILVASLERKYPLLYFAYLLIIILGIIFAPTISNAYEDLLNQGIFEGELQTFTASNFFMLNLPTIILVVGSVSGIALFINLVRGSPREGNLE